MIIDLILDRYDGRDYNPREFYYSVLRYGGRHADNITRALDFSGENEIRSALKTYVLENEYNPLICNFIDIAEWLKAETGKDYSKIYNILQ